MVRLVVRQVCGAQDFVFTIVNRCYVMLIVPVMVQLRVIAGMLAIMVCTWQCVVVDS